MLAILANYGSLWFTPVEYLQLWLGLFVGDTLPNALPDGCVEGEEANE